MEENKIITMGGGGVTSCLSVRLHDAIAFYKKHGHFPEEIDSSGQFGIYRDFKFQNIAGLIFGDYAPDNSIEFVDYDHGWQFAWYDEIQVEKLSKLANMICPMSQEVGNRSYNFMQRIEERTAVLYRGNDKALDIARTHYEAMIQMAQDTQSNRFIVQTDEKDFYEFFKERFPDTIKFSELPQIKKDPDAYVMPSKNKSDFCLNFLAALRAISTAPKIIMNTGNTGIWTVLFRGNVNNVWQAHGKNQQKRKL